MKLGVAKYYIDVIFDQFNAQNGIQVKGALQCIIPFIKSKFPAISTLSFISDNASCFASHGNLPFINSLNENFAVDYHPPLVPIRVKRWVYTEAQTGKDELDTHFSFVNSQFHKYVLDKHNIVCELDIYKALTYDNGLAGSFAILLNGKDFKSINNI